MVAVQNPPCRYYLGPAHPQRSQLCGGDGEGLYEAFGYRPHGLVELVFGSNSHVFATCLPRWLNWPLLLAFLEPITHTGHFGDKANS